MLILISFWLKTTSNNLQILLLPPYLISSILPTLSAPTSPTLSALSSLYPISSILSRPRQLHPPPLVSSILPYLISSNLPYLISSNLSLPHQLQPPHLTSSSLHYIVCAGLTATSEEVPVGLKRERGSVCSTRHCLSLRITIYTCFITSTVLRKHKSPTLPPSENLPRSPENPPREPTRGPPRIHRESLPESPPRDLGSFLH